MRLRMLFHRQNRPQGGVDQRPSSTRRALAGKTPLSPEIGGKGTGDRGLLGQAGAPSQKPKSPPFALCAQSAKLDPVSLFKSARVEETLSQEHDERPPILARE